MHEAIPTLTKYVFMAWYLVKPRDNFTFTWYVVQIVSRLQTVLTEVLNGFTQPLQEDICILS